MITYIIKNAHYRAPPRPAESETGDGTWQSVLWQSSRDSCTCCSFRTAAVGGVVKSGFPDSLPWSPAIWTEQGMDSQQPKATLPRGFTFVPSSLKYNPYPDIPVGSLLCHSWALGWQDTWLPSNNNKWDVFSLKSTSTLVGNLFFESTDLRLTWNTSHRSRELHVSSVCFLP